MMKIDGVSYTNTELYQKHRVLKVFNICRHKDKDGHSLIVFDKKWKGVSPRKYKGICRKCMKEFVLSEDEYQDYLETGEIYK